MTKSRSISFCFFTCVLCTLAFFQAIPKGFAAEKPDISVISDDGYSISIRCTISDYRSEPISIGNDEYTRIWIPNEAISYEKGAPALPYINRSIIIPDDLSMSANIISATYQDLPAKIVPSKGLILRTIDPETIPYDFGETYKIDAFYPADVVTLGEPYIMRDHRGIVVNINPFQYNPVKGILRVYTELTVEVAAIGCGGENVLERNMTRARIRAFEELYSSHFINYKEVAGSSSDLGSGASGDTTRHDSPGDAESGYADGPSPTYVPLDEEGEILIIAHDQWIQNLDQYVTHKTEKGFTVHVVGVSMIGNDSVSIKNYIQDVYNSSDLAFVLLVGDAAQVATITASGGASDPSYSKLAGNDDYPEIMVGRFSAQSADQVDTQVLRTVEYEDMPGYAQQWYKRGTGIASSQGAGQGDEGQADYVHMNEIRQWLLNVGYTIVDQIYDPGAYDYMVANALNEGRGVVNYCGHGSATSWGTTGFNTADVDALVNDNMLPFIVSVACNNGEFDHYDPCFGEAWLRETNESNGEPTGAIGAYMSSISQSWAPPMEGQDEFNIRLTDPAQPYGFYGTLCFAGSSSMMDKYGYDGVNMFNTWIIFGDPSLRILGPHGLDVTPEAGFNPAGQAGGPYDPVSTQYTLENLESVPINYEVTANVPWISIANATGTIPAAGSIQVTVSVNDGARNFDNGKYSASIRFVNLRNHDGDATRPVMLKVGMTAINQWTLDSDPGWSRTGQWQYGKPTGNGGGKGLYPDPTSGATGTNVFGANISGNIAMQVGGPYYLTAGPIDLTSCGDVILKFKRWHNTVGPTKSSSSVQVSKDGTNWTTYWSAGEQLAENPWSDQSIDISPTASNSTPVYVRWGYQVNEKLFNNESSWNIDDIRIEGMTPTSKITLTLGKTQLTWTSLMGAIGYDVVRGDLNTLLSSGGNFTAATDSCLGNNLAAASLNYSVEPATGQGHWFLVRGVSITGPMTYQSLAGNQVGLRDEEINAASNACP